ncbi:MAG: D-glycero-beta-D-manno-heptose 1,7-bisphosphate 7-phosphatase [Fibrobacterales bacterium]
MNKAILLDRDGTLNVDHGYVYRIEDFEWISGVPEALKMLSQAGYTLIVISNQSGISRGYYSLADLEILENAMVEDLKNHGVTIDGFYYCPHQTSDECLCRKPLPQLVERALTEYDIDSASSWMVGDRVRDLQSAEGAGFQLAGVYNAEHIDEFKETPYKVFPSLKEFAVELLKN